MTFVEDLCCFRDIYRDLAHFASILDTQRGIEFAGFWWLIEYVTFWWLIEFVAFMGDSPSLCQLLQTQSVPRGSRSSACCSVLQCVAVCYIELLWGVGWFWKCAAVWLPSLHRNLKPSRRGVKSMSSARCSVLQCVAVCCSVLQCVAVCCSLLQCVAVCCSVLQCVAVW